MTQPRSIARLYVAFQFCFTFLLWVPVFYEYQKRVGLADPQIFQIQSYYYLAFCLFELPTGWFADRFGYLRSMRIGAVLVTLANLIPVLVPELVPSYAGFVAHFVLIALARSLISGASSAWAYEWFRRSGEVQAYKQVEGSARAWGLIGKIAGFAVVGFLMEWWLPTPYVLSAIGTAASIWLAFKMPDVPAERAADIPPVARARANFLSDLAPVARMLARSPRLVMIIFQGVALFVLTRIGQVNLFQPILLAREIPASWHGAILGLISLFEALGAARPGWAQRWLSDLNAVFVLTLVLAASLSLIAATGAAGAIAGLALLSLVTGLSFPIQRQLLNDAIPDARYRATLLSAESIVDRGATAWVASIIGGWIAGGRLGEFLQLSAAVTVVAMAVIYVGARVWGSRQPEPQG